MGVILFYQPNKIFYRELNWLVNLSLMVLKVNDKLIVFFKNQQEYNEK